MADDLKLRRPQDPTKVNVHEDWELRYWCNKWQVTPAALKAVVARVGTGVNAIAKALGKIAWTTSNT